MKDEASIRMELTKIMPIGSASRGAGGQMSRAQFSLHLSDKGDGDWAVHLDGVPVAWFATTTTAKLYIAAEEAARAKAFAKARTASGTRVNPELLNPGPTNADRAGWAEVALAAFMEFTDTAREDALGDLLANLQHWADRERVKFDEALAGSRINYASEIRGEEL